MFYQAPAVLQRVRSEIHRYFPGEPREIMKRTDCEQPIKSFAIEWRATLGREQYEHPSFYAFKYWLRAKGYGSYLNFSSRVGAEYDAELWFDEALGQTWRR